MNAATAQAKVGQTINLKVTLNGFHGYDTNTVRAICTPEAHFETDQPGYSVKISRSAARKFACTSRDCSCGEGLPLDPDSPDLNHPDVYFWIPQEDFEARETTINGTYPQR